MPSIFTTNIGLEEPAFNDYQNSWNVPINANFSLIDQAMGGSTTVSVGSATITLSVAQAAYNTIILTGALPQNVSIIFPSGFGGRRYIWNKTVGNFTVSILNGSGDTNGGVVVGQGIQTPVVFMGNRAYYDNYSSVPAGTILEYTGVNLPAGFMWPIGQQNLSRILYDQLFYNIGTTWGAGDGSTTFGIPDKRGRVGAGADNMGGIAANILPGFTLTTLGGEMNHILTADEMPIHTHSDSGHSHEVSDPGHAHGIPFKQDAQGSGPYERIQPEASSFGSYLSKASFTGVTISASNAAIQNTGGGLAHNNLQPLITCNYILRF